MSVGEDHHIEPGEVDVQPGDVSRKDGDVVTGIEEDALAFKLNQGRVAPVLLKLRPLAKGVVQDCDAVLRRQGQRKEKDCEQGQGGQAAVRQCGHALSLRTASKTESHMGVAFESCFDGELASPSRVGLPDLSHSLSMECSLSGAYEADATQRRMRSCDVTVIRPRSEGQLSRI